MLSTWLDVARGLQVSGVILCRLMVRSGELCVIQRGMKFKVGFSGAGCELVSDCRDLGHSS